MTSKQHSVDAPYKAVFADIIICPLFVLLWMWAFTIDFNASMTHSAVAASTSNVEGSP